VSNRAECAGCGETNVEHAAFVDLYFVTHAARCRACGGVTIDHGLDSLLLNAVRLLLPTRGDVPTADPEKDEC
jgi:hypothetical protein